MKIKKIDKNPFFLVDNDDCGNDFYNKNKDDQSVIIEKLDLLDSSHSFKAIESLFDVSEKTKYNLEHKKFTKSLMINQLMIDGKLSKTTYANFKVVFDKLKEIIKSISVEAKHN